MKKTCKEVFFCCPELPRKEIKCDNESLPKRIMAKKGNKEKIWN
jgi:hypothetical protein